MEWYENIERVYTMGCACDTHCGSDSWGCDNDNEGWHSGDDE